MAQRRAKKRWRPAKAQPAQAAPAANDDQPYDPLVEKLLALFPIEAAAASRARAAGPKSETAAAARKLRRRDDGADRGRVGPTPEQLARGTIAPAKTKDPTQASSITLPRNAAAPIDRWRSRKILDERQFDACEKYRTDYALGGYERSVISRYDGGGSSGDGTPNLSGAIAATLAQIAARERLRAARERLPIRLASHFDAIVLYEAAPDQVGGVLGATGGREAGTAAFTVAICGDILGDWYRLA